MTRIAILLHQRDTVRLDRYRIGLCRQIWIGQGHEVDVLRGVDRDVDADVLVTHVNSTVVPPEYVAFAARFPKVVNGRVRDVSKSAVSTQLVGEDDDVDGPVIVKSNNNYGGCPDLRLAGRHRTPAVRARRLTARACFGLAGWAPPLGKLPLAWVETLPGSRYPVFPSKRVLPASVFRNPALVVERFVPEMDGELFCLRTYSFLGDRWRSSRIRSTTPVVKAGCVVDRTDVPVHEAMVAERARLGFDFGKFDYVVRDGEAVLLDVNPTPTLVGPWRTPEQVRSSAHLAEGIRCWG